MENRPPLLGALPRVLGDYAERGCARFHMPGHKARGLGGFFRESLAGWDVTELSMTDDLHRPEGVLRRTAEQYRRAYGAQDSFLSVGGSSLAVQAMILSLSQTDKLLLGRDCHKSAIAGAILSGIDLDFFDPVYDGTLGMTGLPTPEEADAALAQTGATALLVTSPNAYGFCADIPALAETAHRHGALLLVDAAHGAHFPFSPLLPRPVGGFADLWSHSQHKTMNALTQAATLHLGRCRIAPETVQRQLSLLETSSPSYLLLSSLDWALHTARRQDWSAHAKRCAALSEVISGMAGLSVLHTPALRGAVEHDITRLVIDVSGRGISGYRARTALEAENVFIEMADARRLVLITSPEDDPAWYPRLLDALQRLPYENRRVTLPEPRQFAPQRCLSLREAALADQELLPLADAGGRIAGAAVGLYPPGIAAVTPGERFSREIIDALLASETAGAALFGARGGCVSVVKESGPKHE